MAFGNRDRGRTPAVAGVLAVAITVLAILAGKYASVELRVPSDAELVDVWMEEFFTEEYVVSFLADEVVAEAAAAGRAVAWPPGVDPMDASTQADYPAEVWAEAMLRWSQISFLDKGAFRPAREAETRLNVEAVAAEMGDAVTRDAMLASFSTMDLLFFGLGMVTAFGVGSGRRRGRDLEDDYPRAVKVVMLKVVLADGRIDDKEILAMATAYRQLVGIELSPDTIRMEAEAVAGTGVDLTGTLTDLAPHLDDEQKEVLVEAAMRVASGQTRAGDEEQRIVRLTADAVGMSEAHVQGVMAHHPLSA